MFFVIVSGDKPHACELCNKRFALACNLRAHMKTHEGMLRKILFKNGVLNITNFLKIIKKMFFFCFNLLF